MPDRKPPKRRKKVIPDLEEAVGDLKTGRKTDYLQETGTSQHPGDVGATGESGLPEVATPERLDAENSEESEYRQSPSDMVSSGSPDAGDQGLPGGFAAGEHKNLRRKKAAGIGGTGSLPLSNERGINQPEKKNRKKSKK